MFRGLRIRFVMAPVAAISLGLGSVCGQPLSAGSRVGTPSAPSNNELKELNRKFRVLLRGRPFILHGYLPAEVGNNAPIVLYSSGSGGWHDFDQYVATALAKRGMPVFGVSTHSYLRDFYDDSRPATVAAVAEDYLALIRQARTIANIDDTRPVILAGWSLGAGYAPLVASDPRIKHCVFGVITLALSRDNETALTAGHRLMSHLMGRTIGPSFDVSQYLVQVAPVPVAIIQAAKDRIASPAAAERLIEQTGRHRTSNIRLFQVNAGRTHSFAGARSQVDQTLDEVIAWFRTLAATGATVRPIDKSSSRPHAASELTTFENHAGN